MKDRIITEIENRGESYGVIVVHEDGQIFYDNCSCTCYHGSISRWSKKNKEEKSICRHILKICAMNGLRLQPEYQNERNMKLMKQYLEVIQ